MIYKFSPTFKKNISKRKIKWMYITDVWALRQPEKNPEERAEEDMIEGEQRARVEIEIRKQVDYLMRQEIQQLKEVRL